MVSMIASCAPAVTMNFVGAVVESVPVLEVGTDGLAERQDAGRSAVVVLVGVQRGLRRVDDVRRGVEVGVASTQSDHVVQSVGSTPIFNMRVRKAPSSLTIRGARREMHDTPSVKPPAADERGGHPFQREQVVIGVPVHDDHVREPCPLRVVPTVVLHEWQTWDASGRDGSPGRPTLSLQTPTFTMKSQAPAR